MSDICCPKCGDTNIHITDKGYSLKKGLLGFVALGGVGSLLGFHGNKDALCVCLSCGKKFSPSESGYSYNVPTINQYSLQPTISEQKSIESEPKPIPIHIKSTPPKVTQRVRCTCGYWNNIYNKTCFCCNGIIDLTCMETSNSKQDCISICKCGAKNSIDNKYCILCGNLIDYREANILTDKTVKYNLCPCSKCANDTPAPSRKVKYCAFCGCGLTNNK